ncbi:MAG TPA: response regulator [Oscillatoriaceae cyanobacterium M33_DOE_052]|uniref:histidine kinase n=1 Tax=Planktothricoides sp. SpSt-374 TaxID=2282167 RepID=A0A7C3ZNN8_9CYAN|nr:response regulator [Oscillatoriaceae cyanobacterium M33_DOE_052]
MNLNSGKIYQGNILVVDDTPDNVRLLAAILTDRGYEVRKALNGARALAAVEAALPDLILLDITMPEMNGYQVCQQLKADAKTRDVPVIFISALNEVMDKQQAFDVGGADYIVKPFQGAEVILRIENQLKLRSLQANLAEKNLALERSLSELKTTQLHLIQNEKMTAMGQLVAGIAHEINNPINFVSGNLKYAEQYIKDLLKIINIYQQEYSNPSAMIQEKLEEIDLNFLRNDAEKVMDAMCRGADRIRQIVLALRNFSRHDEAEMKPVEIHNGIDSTLLMLQHRMEATKYRPAIEVIKEYAPLPLVTCYVSQLNQVFLHLLNNAIDALNPDLQHQPTALSSIPKIWIMTELIDSKRIRIRIADNGPGIAEAIRSRLFDPFFTTKPVGAGTGLGLSISYQIIVHQHGGSLACTSAPGAGAEFTIEIPLCQPEL